MLHVNICGNTLLRQDFRWNDQLSNISRMGNLYDFQWSTSLCFLSTHIFHSIIIISCYYSGEFFFPPSRHLNTPIQYNQCACSGQSTYKNVWCVIARSGRSKANANTVISPHEVGWDIKHARTWHADGIYEQKVLYQNASRRCLCITQTIQDIWS